MTTIEKLHPAYLNYLELLHQIKNLREQTSEKRKALQEAEKKLVHFLQGTENKKELHIEEHHQARYGNCTALKIGTQTNYESLGKKKLLQYLLQYFQQNPRFVDKVAGEAIANDIALYIANQTTKKETVVIRPSYPPSAKKRKGKKDQDEEDDVEDED